MALKCIIPKQMVNAISQKPVRGIALTLQLYPGYTLQGQDFNTEAYVNLPSQFNVVKCFKAIESTAKQRFEQDGS